MTSLFQSLFRSQIIFKKNTLFVKNQVINLLNISKKNVKTLIINSLNDLSILSTNDIIYIYKIIKIKRTRLSKI